MKGTDTPKGMSSITQLLCQKGSFVIVEILLHHFKAIPILDLHNPAGNLIRIPQFIIISIGCQITAGIVFLAVNRYQIAIV